MRELTLGANLPLSELNRLPWRYIPGKYKWKLEEKKLPAFTLINIFSSYMCMLAEK